MSHVAPVSRKILVLVAGALLMATALPASALTLASHRAFYELEVSRIDNTSGYSSVQGKLAYELSGSVCEGWAVNYRIANRYVEAEKGSRVLDTQLTTWESGDGLEMNLSQKQFVDSTLDSEERLKVKRPKMGAEAQGNLTLPKEQDFTVPGDAVFPSTHQARLLDAANKGILRDVSVVFDGSDGDKIYKAISFIGKKRAPGTFALDAANPQTEPLRKLASWPVTVSYYLNAGEKAEAPIYQASFNMYENGVSTNLLMDYGSYALKGTLTKLELLKTQECQ
jgi:EipB-like